MQSIDERITLELTNGLRDWGFTHFFTLTLADDDDPIELGKLCRQFIHELANVQGYKPDFWYSISSSRLGEERYHIHGFLDGVGGLDEPNIEAAWRSVLNRASRRGTAVARALTGRDDVYGYAARQARWSHSNIPELKAANIRSEILDEVTGHD